MIKWNFPGNQDGQIKGVADAGIETFNGTELSSLAREVCQNSLDAAIDDENPDVFVEFERYFIRDKQIPGVAEYRSVLEKCQSFWNTSKSEKAKAFLKRAVEQAWKEKAFMLRISDYNTTGLSDPYANTENSDVFSFDGWNALIKIDGGANKGDDKAGAFGIGKNAPFSNSFYRLVFYRTFNQAGERAAQGISRLLSYKESSLITSGVGYYGNPIGNNPVESIPELDAIKERSETGTDVFIYGFKTAEDWEVEITAALLENFLMSFFYGLVKVRVQNHLIDTTTLKNLVSKIYNERSGFMKGTYGNYLALTRADGVYTFSKNFHGLGTLELRLLVDPNEKLDRKVLIVRKAGMKLFRLGNISKVVPFTGILELKGKELNKYFRTMETVAHDNWEPGRHSNPKQAKAYYEEIKEWIRDIVAKLGEHSSDDEMNVEGLSGILQDEPDVQKTGESDKKIENLNDHLGSIEVIERPTNTPSKGFFYGKGAEGKKDVDYVPGDLGPTGEPGLRILKGKRKRKKLDTHQGTPNPDGRDIVTKVETGGETSCPLRSVRVIKMKEKTYMVCFSVPHDVSKGRIELVAVGENGKANRLRITDVSPSVGCTSTKLSGDYVEVTDMSSSMKVRFIVSLADSHDYAMEINVYEHN